MPAIDFPNNPSINDEFEINGTIYYWTGSAWEIKFIPAAILSNSLPQNNGTASAGTSNFASRSDHIHATDTSRASATDLSTHISATTSVHGIADTANLVLTNDSRLTDARSPTAHASSHGSAGSDPITVAQSQVTNLTTDLSAKAPLESPALTGTPTAPTAAASTNTTQIATTAFVNTEISNIVGSAPSNLNTLSEIASAIGNDPSFSTTVSTALSGKEPTITAGTTSQYWRGDKSWQTLDKSAVGLGNVENTALSTWSGSSNITSVGTLENLTVTNTITGSITGNAGTVTNGVYTTGTYSNPDWITGLAWSKISSTPTTLGGYGIIDAQPLDSDLTAIAALTGTAGFLKTNGSGTWTVDTATYLTSSTASSTYAPLSSPTFTGTVTVPTPANSTDAATKAYVDEVAEGLKTKPAVEIATTANISATYSNGTNGVGATLTANSNGAFPEIDGVTLTSTTPGQNGVLVKNQSNPAHNGRYDLTQVGNGSTPWILTRSTLCDQANEIPGSYIFVKRGTINVGTGWVQVVANPTTFAVGTDAITVTQFSGVSTYTAGTGLSLVGIEFNNTGVLSITGTTNEIDVSTSTGNITLSLPATISADINGNAATVTNGVYTTGSYSDPSWLTISKSKVGLSNVENTALSTWTGSSNITTLGTIGSGTWNGSTISATYIDSSIARLVSPSFTTPNIGVASSISLTIDSSALIDTSTTTINTNSATTINSISASTYRSAEYLVQVTQGTKYTVSKLIMTHNGSTVTITEYAVIELGASRIPLTISGELEGGNIVIKATITDASTTNATAKVVKTAMVL